jgi:alpha-L-fucosidase 2
MENRGIGDLPLNRRVWFPSLSHALKLPARAQHQDKYMRFAAWLAAICLISSMTASAASAETFRDIEYSAPESMSLRLDASIPPGDGPFPVAIIVHGGGWVGGSRKNDVYPLFKPLSDAGIAWFSIDYRLATDPIHFGVAIEDVEAAVRFVKAHFREYRVDPERVALIGESAGGQLAAMAALGRSQDTSVKAVVAIYAPTDLVSLLKSSNLIPLPLRNSLEGTPFENLLTARLAQLSPIEKVHAGMPPFLMIHGTVDPLVPFAQSRAMCSRMQSVGAPCQLFKVPGAGHGIRRWEGDPAMSQPYKAEMVRWLKEQLAPVTLRAL